MNIEKLKSGSYRIRETYHGKTYRITVPFKPSKHEAQELIMQRIQSQDTPVQNIRTFSDACLAYIDLKDNVLSPSTITGYRSVFRALSSGIKECLLVDMTAVIVQKEINDYSSSHSPKSVRNMHGFISAVLSVYRPSLVLHTTLPQKSRYEANTPTEQDVKTVLDAVKGTRYEIPYRLACYGLRRGEICALTAADLNGNMLTINKAIVITEQKEYVIRPMPKTTESNRTIYIDDDLSAMIRNTDGLLFSGYPNRLNDHLSELQKRLDLPRFRFHDFRAYYASMAHSLGVPDAYIMANGGWSSPYVMNRVYRRALSDKQAEANRKIANALKPD